MNQQQLSPGPVPEHVAVIMDGNGRWARQRGMERLFGHQAGTDSVRACCEYAVECGIRYLSLFAFSEENWARPREEVSGLMELMAQSVIGEMPTFRRNNIRFRVIGDRSRLSPALAERISEAESDSAGNTGLTLIVFLSYSGKWDLQQAAVRYAQACLRAREEGRELPPASDYPAFLSTAGIPDPDLLIRTSGEQRISNFLLWQCAYTEFYFTDVLWPDFRKAEFRAAIEDFRCRKRRFGRTEEQVVQK